METWEQAAALTVLGQAMESLASDPRRAETTRSEFFCDPFVVAGGRAEHANILYQIIDSIPHLHYYMLNSWGVGGVLPRRLARFTHRL